MVCLFDNLVCPLWWEADYDVVLWELCCYRHCRCDLMSGHGTRMTIAKSNASKLMSDATLFLSRPDSDCTWISRGTPTTWPDGSAATAPHASAYSASLHAQLQLDRDDQHACAHPPPEAPLTYSSQLFLPGSGTPQIRNQAFEPGWHSPWRHCYTPK